jgi:NAD(P)-dependent dehydrogenase (short-subunit alcohol dehydrogenase family)
MDLQLKDRRALVTGGSMGIGRAIARQLAREGVRVAIAARNADRCNETARALVSETGGEVFAAQADTSDTASVTALIDGVNARLGGIDILVNCAARVAGSAPPTLDGVTDELFWGELNTKVMGYIRTARAVAPGMIARRWGRIINVAGLHARRATSIVGSIRNIGVAALTKNLADELGPHGINVTVVHPGYTRTERTPQMIEAIARAQGAAVEDVERGMANNALGRIIESEEVADVVAFLASPRSVAINGDAIAVGGGSLGAIHY